jgi:hypothetical protein
VPAAINPEVTPESIRARIDGTFPGDLGVDRRHLHPGGYVHGGAWVALADSVAAWGGPFGTFPRATTSPRSS